MAEEGGGRGTDHLGGGFFCGFREGVTNVAEF
jgi:hypothetical protein